MTLDLDDAERELIRCTLEFWTERLFHSSEAAGAAHQKAGEFTSDQIAKLMKKLQALCPTT